MTAIKGKVIFSLPAVGLVVNLIKTPMGVIGVLGLALWLMERSFRKEKNSKQEQLQQIRAEIEQLKQQQK